VPFTSQGCPAPKKKILVIYDASSIREPPKVLNVLKLMGKHFIDPNSSEILFMGVIDHAPQFFFGRWRDRVRFPDLHCESPVNCC
jgi:hypothetical protein